MSQHNIELATAIAMQACTALQQLDGGHAIETLTGQELVFCLMPLRHSESLDSIKLVESLVLKREERLLEEAETLKNFKKATVRRRRAAEDLTRHHAVDVTEFQPNDLLEGPDLDNPDISGMERTKIHKAMVEVRVCESRSELLKCQVFFAQMAASVLPHKKFQSSTSNLFLMP